MKDSQILQAGPLDVAAARSQVGAQGAQGAEAQQVRQQLLESEAALDLAQAKLAQTEIRAPAAGVVLERLTEPGDIAQPAKRMMTLALDGPSRLIVQVDEKNLPLLTQGRSAMAAADAFPNERFAAVIAYISPGVDASRGTVELRLDIPKPPVFLKSDMTVSIDLTGPVLKQALIIPADAIRQLQSDAPYVLVMRDDVARRVAVRSGAQTQGRVQILEGVAPGERVIVSRDVEAGALEFGVCDFASSRHSITLSVRHQERRARCALSGCLNASQGIDLKHPFSPNGNLSPVRRTVNRVNFRHVFVKILTTEVFRSRY